MMSLSNMKVGKRLALGFGVCLALTIGIAGMAWWGGAALKRASDDSAKQSRMGQTAQSMTLDVANIYLEMWHLAATNDQGEKLADKELIEKLRVSYKASVEDLKAQDVTETGKRLLQKVVDTITDAREVNQRVTDLAMQGKSKEADRMLSTAGRQRLALLHQATNEYLQFRELRAKESQDAMGQVQSRVYWLLAILIVMVVGVTAFFASAVSHSITTPVLLGVNLLQRISQGDVTQNVPGDMQARSDELGDLAKAMQTMTDSLRRLLGGISGGVHTLATSATELSAISKQTTAGTASMSEKTDSVAAAAEESCATTMSVAVGMEQSSSSLSSVASATEQMSATVGDIAANTARARTISEQASAQARAITEQMQKLGQAAQEIGHVTETITNISAQTNLLALNATIEAARAGTAGKGFAVVANEIKELARQTAEATEDIKARIGGIQSSTGTAVSDISQIATVIKDVGAIVASIAAAIEEQATVTKDVAGNIAQASAGVQDANRSIAQTAEVSRSIARDISGVNMAVAEIRQGGEQVQLSAAELSQLAEQLSAQVAQFRM